MTNYPGSRLKTQDSNKSLTIIIGKHTSIVLLLLTGDPLRNFIGAFQLYTLLDQRLWHKTYSTSRKRTSMRFFSVTLLFLVPVASQICKNSMYSNNTEVLQAHNSMLNSYFVRCFRDDSCSVEVDEVISSSFEDYTNLGNEVQFVSQYSNTCGEFNYSVCQLNIDYMIFRPNLFQYIKEVNKPFCLPNSCAENQVHSLDIYVPSCSAAGENCTKALIGVMCPNDRVLDVTGNCTEDLPGPFSRLNFLRSSIYAAMESRCASGNVNPNEYCIQERSEASVSSTSDFNDFIEEAQTPYVSFAQTCLKEEGE